MHLLFDLSLTVASPWLPPPSGINRVEMAHARHWLRRAPRDVTFVMRTCWGRLAALPHAIAARILDDMEHRVGPGEAHRAPGLHLLPAAALTLHFYGLGRRSVARRIAAGDAVFLTVSCATLHKEAAVADLTQRGARCVALVHDLIALSHPHCFPEGEQARHAIRMGAIARHADAVVAVSAATEAAMRDWFTTAGLRLPPLTVAHPGIDLPAPLPAPAAADDPYFVILGSLEPRKNHWLLLELWRELARLPGAPRLVVVGRMPYEPHAGLHLLERGDFGGRVAYLGRLSDAEATRLLRGARALLFPSLIEGFGLPVGEALALGVPVIASDIPAFREVGGGVPDLLPPLDGPAWRAAILDYAAPDSARRAAQLARLPGWRAPAWDAHFAAVERVLDASLSQPRPFSTA